MDRLLSSNVLTSEAKLGDPPLLQLSFYSMHEHFKINSFGGNTRDMMIIGYACITNTAVTLNEMVETPIATFNFSRVWNRLVEKEGSIDDKKRTETEVNQIAHPRMLPNTAILI